MARFFITPHAAMRAMQRGIGIDEINKCLFTGKRTLHYPSGICECSVKVRNPCGKVYVILDKARRVIITVYRTKWHRRACNSR